MEKLEDGQPPPSNPSQFDHKGKHRCIIHHQTLAIRAIQWDERPLKALWILTGVKKLEDFELRDTSTPLLSCVSRPGL